MHSSYFTPRTGNTLYTSSPSPAFISGHSTSPFVSQSLHLNLEEESCLSTPMKVCGFLFILSAIGVGFTALVNYSPSMPTIIYFVGGIVGSGSIVIFAILSVKRCRRPKEEKPLTFETYPLPTSSDSNSTIQSSMKKSSCYDLGSNSTDEMSDPSSTNPFG